MVYGSTCIDRPTGRSTDRPTDRAINRPTDRPTDRPCPSHSRDTDTLHVPTLPSRYGTLMSVQCVVEIATRLRTPTMGKRKADTRATNCEAGTRDQRTSSYLRFLVGVVMHPWVSRTSVFLAGYFTQTPFHTFLHKHNTRAHCILDKTLIRTRNAYGGAYRPHPLA